MPIAAWLSSSERSLLVLRTSACATRAGARSRPERAALASVSRLMPCCCATWENPIPESNRLCTCPHTSGVSTAAERTFLGLKNPRVPSWRNSFTARLTASAGTPKVLAIWACLAIPLAQNCAVIIRNETLSFSSWVYSCMFPLT